MWGLTHYGTPSDFAWDVVSGVSAGAINTGAIATWATGTEVEMTEWISDTWANLTTEDVCTPREGSELELLFKEQSFMDNSALLDTLTEINTYKGEIARRFVISAVDTNTGDYVAMTQKDTPFEDLSKA